MGRPHVMFITYPEQGHVRPLLIFSRNLASQGITFVNTEFNHNRIISSLSKPSHDDHVVDGIKLVSIPDGLEDSPEEKNVPGKLSESVLRFMPTKVEELIERMISETSGAVISCVVADQSLGWAMEVAAKFGIRRAAFCPAAAASMVLGFRPVAYGASEEIGPFRISKGGSGLYLNKFAWNSLANLLLLEAPAPRMQHVSMALVYLQTPTWRYSFLLFCRCF
ncbi:UDP-glycosyltransferase 83A1 [Brassica rapa]|uniref:UDP-glycosyltransferase 83A1 n=1 Tax=Brassica campestris TaxID=3711 RepID=UPI00142E5B20|nr:UDP-glycosyltransferase 83A1 [Brassica rapa]